LGSFYDAIFLDFNWWKMQGIYVDSWNNIKKNIHLQTIANRQGDNRPDQNHKPQFSSLIYGQT